MDRDDVLSLADAALMEAWQGYDPARGARFSTYAYPWVRGAILRASERTNQRLCRQQPLTQGAIVSPSTLVTIEARNALERIPRRDRSLVLAHLLEERPFNGLVRGCSASAVRRRYHRALALARASS